jgi:hypothetical protein
MWSLGYPGTGAPVPGLAENYKALAVAMAPWLAFLWAVRERLPPSGRRVAIAVVVAGAGALLAALSKSALLVAAFGFVVALAFRGGVHSGRALAIVVAVLLAAAGLAALTEVWSPAWLGDGYLARALADRRAIDLRQWRMLAEHPWVGSGAGSSIAIASPDASNIDGVDAHGIVQKLAGETGALGLFAYSAYVAALIGASWRAASDPARIPALVLVLALHLNLAWSTETWSPSHWAPLAIALGLLRPRS